MRSEPCDEADTCEGATIGPVPARRARLLAGSLAFAGLLICAGLPACGTQTPPHAEDESSSGQAPAQPSDTKSGPPPELKDPFHGERAPTPSTRISPDLKDPFANTPPASPAPRDHSGAQVSPDLKDPFAKEREHEAPSEPAPQPGSPQVSPDLKDPFAK